ncbi:hypothetical protein E4U47_001164 [Claviceps purpurea]|nr:hypothetical protein E4U47_001164 [Claviceps purpurea]KAG6285732.1 hypothetical protein E4U45_000251 [Claviceps purpurea]
MRFNVHHGYLPNLPDLRGSSIVRLQFDHSRNGLGVELGAHKVHLQAQLCGNDYDSGSGRCEPIGRNVVAPDRFREDCHQAGTVDGFYRYNKDDTVDTSQTFWVQDTSATCD